MTKNNEIAVRNSDELPRPSVEPRIEETYVAPFADIYETPDAYVLTLDMPGATKDAINVTLDKGVLTVKAGVKPYHRENATLLFREIQTTGYLRGFNLGEGIDKSNIDAHYEDGVLTLKLFKSEQLKPKEIPIK